MAACMDFAADVNSVTELSAKYEKSFAYKTIKDRLPIILTKVIDHLSRKKDEICQEYAGTGSGDVPEEVKTVIGRLSKLRNELQTDKDFQKVTDDLPETGVWNKTLQNPPAKRWFEAAWLFTECYFYRRIKEAFRLSPVLKDYDYFAEQKNNALVSTMNIVDAFTEHLTEPQCNLSNREYLEISLWGNKCDLSLSAGNATRAPDLLIGQLQALRSQIICDNTTAILEYINSKNGNLNLHFVLDNAGFELASDLILLDHLTSKGIIKTVTLFVKKMPWFVSDALTHDINFVVNYLSTKGNAATKALGERCRKNLEDGTWTISEQDFWTLPFDYSQMKTQDPALYSKLSEGDLIIFKGDLNYRKLIGDLNWPPTTDFKTSLRGFLPAPVVTLRTIKADTISGLPVGAAEQSAAKASDWMTSGEFAVIQFAK